MGTSDLGTPTKGTNAAFDPGQFDQMIYYRGVEFQWSRALKCMCTTDDRSLSVDPTCSFCTGEGYIYVNPDPEKARRGSENFLAVRGVFSSNTHKPTVTDDQLGVWASGRALITIRNAARVGFRDKFISLQQEMAFDEVLVRTTSLGNSVRVGKSGNGREWARSAMRYEPVLVNYVIDKEGTAYWRGLDFTISPATSTEPRRMKWVTGRGPADAMQYSVHYTCRPVWVVDDHVYHIQHSVGPLGVDGGVDVVQDLPTSFNVILDYYTEARGT